jgi:hypothetical protein
LRGGNLDREAQAGAMEMEMEIGMATTAGAVMCKATEGDLDIVKRVQGKQAMEVVMELDRVVRNEVLRRGYGLS